MHSFPRRGRLVPLAALVSLLAALPGRAAYTGPGIEIDGDYVDAAASSEEDWFPSYPPLSDPIGSADGTLCDGTSPAPKNDILNSFLANNFDHLFVGMERLTNNGNTSFFFSFDITGNGPSLGDFIFVFCFGSGPVVTETYVLEWDEALGEWARDATPPEVIFAVNADRVLAPFGSLDEHGNPASVLDEGRFAEARIRLADIEGFDVCEASDVVGEIQTKSSCSLSSQCKDTTGPFRFDFGVLATDLRLVQSPGCVPELVAVANARSPRGRAVTYRWFLDGTDITDRDPSWATSDRISIALADECGPTVVRVVVDDGACTAEDEGSVDVNRRPVATIGGLAAGACDRRLTFDGAGSTDCSGASLSYAWDFDSDGSVDSTEAAGTHLYPTCGGYLVTLVVSDGECASEPVTQAVHVNEPPRAALQVIPGDCLTLDWSAGTSDCDLLRPSPLYTETLTRAVDFGDGSPLDTGSSGTHHYDACGSYLLTLTVTDASGCTATSTREVVFTGVLTVE